MFLKSPKPQETFFFLLMRRASGFVCRECQWRALFAAGSSSALNLLRISSSLAAGWENTVVAVCGTARLSSVPQPLPWLLLLSISWFIFFICSPAWFTATSARMISMSSLAPSWRWQALDPSPFLISPSCAVSRSSASLADFQEVREGENGEVLLQFLMGSGKQGSSKGIALVCRYQWVPVGVGDR